VRVGKVTRDSILVIILSSLKANKHFLVKYFSVNECFQLIEHNNLAASSLLSLVTAPDHIPHHPLCGCFLLLDFVGSFAAACSWLLTVTKLLHFVGWPYPAPAWSILAKPTEPREERETPDRPGNCNADQPDPALPYQQIPPRTSQYQQACSTSNPSRLSPGVKLMRHATTTTPH
jgi:hypothetical protein